MLIPFIYLFIYFVASAFGLTPRKVTTKTIVKVPMFAYVFFYEIHRFVHIFKSLIHFELI